MTWRGCTLGDVVKLQRGHDLPAKKRQSGEVPIVSSSGITGFHNEAKAQPPGVVTGRYGTIGQVLFIEEPYWPLNTALYAVDYKNNDPRFVAYLLRSTLRNYKSEKAAVPGVDRNVLHTLPVRAPGPTEQKAVASILSAYDDLIENNRRRIALLEESARLLYREWFVHLRFPGYEHVETIDGAPEGWTHQPVAKLANISRGKSYKSSELGVADGLPFINLKCFERLGGFRVSGLKWFKGEFKDQHRASAGDIVIAVTDMTRDALVVAQAARIPQAVGEEAVFSMDLVKATPANDIEPSWLYGMLRFSTFSREVREHATGATVLHLKPKHIESWRVLVPPRNLRRLFAEQFDALLKQIDNLELQNEKLGEARDLLLPRLMSGEITV